MPTRHAASPYQPTLRERCEIAKEHGRVAAGLARKRSKGPRWSKGTGTLRDKWWIIANDARGYPVLEMTGEPPIVGTKAECKITVGRPPDFQLDSHFQLDQSIWASYPSKRECQAWYEGLLEGDGIKIDRTTYAGEWD